MLAYNGLPNVVEEYRRYPKTPKDKIIDAIERLQPGALSWSEGSSEPGVFDADIVFYKISTYCGASGSGIFDDKRTFSWFIPFIFKLTEQLAIHSRGEAITHSDGTNYIDPTCLNKGVALDCAVASNFVKTVFGPRLRKDIRAHWINF